MAAVEAKRWPEAYEVFTSLYARDPALVDARHGSAAYWYGATVLHLERDTVRTLRIWQAGLGALDLNHHFDPLLWNGYAKLAARAGTPAQRVRAADAYLTLLTRADSLLEQPDPYPFLAMQIRRFLLLWPDSLHDTLVRDNTPSTMVLHEGSGRKMAKWWRSQDPLPETARHERLEEHVARVAYAETHFADSLALHGLDARGVVYVRFGPPDRIQYISYNHPRLKTYFSYVPTVARLGHRNSVWYYDRLGPRAYYVFVDRGFGYQEARITDILSNRLQTGLASQASPLRGGNGRSLVAFFVLMDFYHQLAQGHTDFSPLHQQLETLHLRHYELMDSLLAFAENPAPLTPRLSKRLFDPTTSRFRHPLELINHELNVAFTRLEHHDFRVARIRDQTLPHQRSQALDSYRPLPVRYHTARLLAPDGSTRTLISWVHEPGSLSSPADTLTLTAQQLTADYRLEDQHRQPYVATPAEQANRLLTRTVILGEATGPYHVHLQWKSTPASPQDVPQVSVYKSGVLDAIDSDQRFLQMSDLIPTTRSQFSWDAQLPSLDTINPYPLPVITPDTQLGVYFELYHLTFGDEDKTHYQIAYETEAKHPKSFLRRQRTTRTTFQHKGGGTSRTESIHLALDLRHLVGAEEVTLRVVATDQTSGHQQERTLTLAVQPSPKSE